MAKAMQPQKMRFSQAIQTPMYKSLVNNTLGDPARGARFIANITSAVAVNPALQECNPGTILAGALLGESLLLQPSPQLGQFYLVPFKSKAKRDRQGNVIEPASVKAQFVLGYKGYIQLALRTGQYKRLNVLEVKSGELSGWDPLKSVSMKCTSSKTLKSALRCRPWVILPTSSISMASRKPCTGPQTR